MDKFKSKTTLLKEIGLNENIIYSVVLCIVCYVDDFPAMVVDPDMIHFLSEINAEISFDIMTFDNEDEDE